MATISKKIRDSALHISTSSVIYTYNLSYPIIWEGFLNTDKIQIIQVDSVTFEFEGIRGENFHLRDDIIEEINNFLDEKLK